MAEHRCRACVVYCMDFRLHESLANFFAEQKLDGDGADVIRVGGAIKSLSRPKEARDREFLLEQLNVAYALHGVRQFYLINHEDCGAYGLEDVVDSPEELATHREDLRVAKILIQDRFPDTEILTYFMKLSGTAEVVD
ncbi:MAG: carbonic anhydrase [Syntrophobacteria bacterium]